MSKRINKFHHQRASHIFYACILGAMGGAFAGPIGCIIGLFLGYTIGSTLDKKK